MADARLHKAGHGRRKVQLVFAKDGGYAPYPPLERELARSEDRGAALAVSSEAPSKRL